jgi:hypothetical protein
MGTDLESMGTQELSLLHVVACHNRCWTADQLARNGLPHPACYPLCDREETINHLLISCTFARKFWFHLLHKVGPNNLSPQQDEISFDNWWLMWSWEWLT